MADREQVEEWAERYRRAWEERDPEAAAALFSEQASYRSEIYEEPHRGREGVAAYWAGVTAGQSGVTVRMGSPVIDRDRANVEFWTTMTIESNPVTLAGCLLLTFGEGGLCTDLREYWNFTDGTRQPPQGWGG